MSDSFIAGEEIALGAVGPGGEGGYLHVMFDGRVWGTGGDQKIVAWKVLSHDMSEIGSGYDMSAPEFATSVSALSSLVSFLLACAESKSEESENYSLFDSQVREWAEMNSDELQMLAVELEGEE